MWLIPTSLAGMAAEACQARGACVAARSRPRCLAVYIAASAWCMRSSRTRAWSGKTAIPIETRHRRGRQRQPQPLGHALGGDRPGARQREHELLAADAPADV